jgi:hypothetical protein
MKKLLLAGLMVGLLAVQALVANQITTTGGAGYGPYQTGSGGEFTFLTDAGSSWILNNGYVDGVTKNVLSLQGTFETFCVEHNEFVYPNTTYDYTINNISVFTGMPLTLGAAWLYHQFQIGTLNYDYANRTTAAALQNAIWFFMGQGADPLNAYSVMGWANGGLAPNNGAIPVAVLNLWVPGMPHDPAHAVQDMLVCVPDGGLTLTLLGMGLGSLTMLSRRIRS